ncbi:hypothetical protein ABGB18_22905 [Nonomuraea sp. B12E4]|uniref:hypothetical protein n=1 Tax=Nonomuraea sp. B12E4 TaxID=3153564 RepID=UPI00325F341C
MKRKWVLVAASAALAGSGAAVVLSGATAGGGPTAAMPIIYGSYPEAGHAHVPAESLRNDRRPKILASSPGRPLTLTGLLGNPKGAETVSAARFRRGWGEYVVTQAEIDARQLAKAESIAPGREEAAYFLRARFMGSIKLLRIIK